MYFNNSPLLWESVGEVVHAGVNINVEYMRIFLLNMLNYFWKAEAKRFELHGSFAYFPPVVIV